MPLYSPLSLTSPMAGAGLGDVFETQVFSTVEYGCAHEKCLNIGAVEAMRARTVKASGTPCAPRALAAHARGMRGSSVAGLLVAVVDLCVVRASRRIGTGRRLPDLVHVLAHRAVGRELAADRAMFMIDIFVQWSTS